MDKAWATKFSDLTFEASCCGRAADLNRLVYEWPAGFACFVLEVSGLNVRQFLPDALLERVAESLGSPVRQILSRY